MKRKKTVKADPEKLSDPAQHLKNGLLALAGAGGVTSFTQTYISTQDAMGRTVRTVSFRDS